MPWKGSPVSEVRLALCHSVRTLRASVSDAARRFGVSRRTAHKWLRVYDAAAAAGAAPLAVLCDNAFGTMGTARPAGVSWFDSNLIRAGVRPAHGRPYHPQTQGKVERLNGSASRELIGFNARLTDEAHFRDDCRAWRHVYNTLRPHEAIGDVPPASRWAPSPRRCPARLPEPDDFCPAGSQLRTVDGAGQISFGGYRILCGRGIAGHRVRVEPRDDALAVFYCWKQFRLLSHDQLLKGKIL